MADREKVIKALEDFNKNRICLPHLIPWDEIADVLALLKEQNELLKQQAELLKEQEEQLKQSDERYFNMVISWFREMITFYEFHLQTQSNRHTTFIEAFKDVHDFAYDSLRDYFKQKGGKQNA